MHSTKQAAEALGVSVRTIHRLVSAGELVPVLKLPGRTGPYLFDDAEIIRTRATPRDAA